MSLDGISLSEPCSARILEFLMLYRSSNKTSSEQVNYKDVSLFSVSPESPFSLMSAS